MGNITILKRVGIVLALIFLEMILLGMADPSFDTILQLQPRGIILLWGLFCAYQAVIRASPENPNVGFYVTGCVVLMLEFREADPAYSDKGLGLIIVFIAVIQWLYDMRQDELRAYREQEEK